jgi:hypothetical protein
MYDDSYVEYVFVGLSVDTDVTVPDVNWRPWGDVVLEGYSMRLKPSRGQGRCDGP